MLLQPRTLKHEVAGLGSNSALQRIAFGARRTRPSGVNGRCSVNEETRVSLWEAFSDFFLDTEISDLHFIHAARVVKKSGISPAEAEAILWNEVFPVLYPNLLSVTGEWAGWSREWLKANLRPASGPARRAGPASAVQEIQRCWEQVLKHLELQT